MITLGDYLVVSAILFTIGFAGVMLRRNLTCDFDVARADVERGQSVARSFLSDFVGPNGLPNYNAQVFVFFVITVAAAEVAVRIALLVALYRARQTTDVADISSLKF